MDELQAIHRIGVLLGEEAGPLLNELMRTKPLPMVHPWSSRPSDPSGDGAGSGTGYPARTERSRCRSSTRHAPAHGEGYAALTPYP